MKKKGQCLTHDRQKTAADKEKTKPTKAIHSITSFHSTVTLQCIHRFTHTHARTHARTHTHTHTHTHTLMKMEPGSWLLAMVSVVVLGCLCEDSSRWGRATIPATTGYRL